MHLKKNIKCPKHETNQLPVQQGLSKTFLL